MKGQLSILHLCSKLRGQVERLGDHESPTSTHKQVSLVVYMCKS